MGLLGLGAIAAIMAQPGLTEEIPLATSDADIPRVQDAEAAATTVEERVSQISVEAAEATWLIAQAAIQITGVQLTPTENGVEINLETTEQLQPPTTSTVGNALIADLSNTTLVLPEANEFQAVSPAEGIALVSVTNLPDNRVRVAITGVDAPPTANITAVEQGLVVSVAPGTEVGATEDDAIQVVVTATRTEEEILDVPRSVTVIEREEIEEASLLSNNLSTILGTLVPGFGPPTATGSTRAQSLRGRPALILIDGIPQNTNTSFSTELFAIDPSAIERIEVVRGPSAIYGNGATGGIVNIITRRPTEEGFVSEASLSLISDLVDVEEDGFGYGLQYGFSGREGNVDFRVGASFDSERASFDAEGDRVPPNGLSTDNRLLNFLARVGVEITDEQRLELSYNIFNNDFESNFISDPAIFQIPDLQKARALEVGDILFDESPQQTVQNLNFTYRHDDIFGSELNAQLYYRTTELTQDVNDIRGRFPPEAFPDAPRLFQTNLDSTSFGTRLQLDTPFSESLSLLWGVDYNSEENEAPFNALDLDAFDQRREARIIGNPTQTPFYSLDSLGLFAQLNWDVSDRWLVSGGLRYENITADIDDYTASPFSNVAGSPPQIEGGRVNADDVVFNVGLVYAATPNVGLFANFAQGFSIPRLSTVLGFLPAGTNIEDSFSLEPQKVDNYEIGVRGIWDDLQLSLAGFFNESELGSALIVDPTGFTDVVRAPQRNYGVELTADWSPVERWQIGGALTWNEGEFDAQDDGSYLALSSIEVQPLSFTLYVENETLPGWRNRLQALTVGSRDRAFDDGVDQFNIDGYTTLDLISSLRLGSSGRLELGIQNLLNEQYFPVDSQERIGIQEIRRYAAQGRTISLRYAITF
ncbi:MAG: TonB-dependent receptor [Leptolyngbyaceae cyanobacterium SL_5_9]|nr:TonB-dependent receptor [Leptolyngbyaceae cyanobacterium SL_5_9]NJO73585.1 TonB-dependent receptor [Leptolyngbyaceae cyanobacterium RM1_406_9]